jgi:NAD(P)H-hydrate epimerase
MKIVTAAEMREIDRVTGERFAVPSLTLMENAGSAVAEFALSAYPAARSFGVICGKGNNGGDGFVVARKLHEAGREVRLLLLADPAELRGDAAENFKRLPKSAGRGRAAGKGNGKPGTARFSLNTLKRSSRAAASATLPPNAVFASDVLIDAVLGTGFKPPVSGLYADAIRKINAATAPVIAVDIPSGADADVVGDQIGAVARDDGIVTFTAPRPAHVFGNLTPGPTVIAPIGSPDDAIQSSLNLNLITPKDIVPLFGPRPRNSNKGMFGHVLVVGGSVGKAGAAAMAGFSALRTGAGLVTVATPRSVLATVAGFHPELMTEPLSETDSGSIALAGIKSFWQLAEQKSVLAVGPGISRHVETAEFVRTVVQDSKIPIVLDADGLNAFQGRARDLTCRERKANAKGAEGLRTLVLTPHPGEMARLTGLSTAQIQRDRVNIARKFAQEHGLILVLKGDRTVVAAPDGETWINPTGNPGMATGGTGDILTGIVAGMLAQNLPRAFQSVMAAVYLHGLAGDIACAHLGECSLVATDLIKALPEAFRRVRLEAAEKWVKIGMPAARGLMHPDSGLR